MDNSCPIGDQFGAIYMLPYSGSCYKIELFDGGLIESDSSNAYCTNSIFASSQVISTFDQLDSVGNVALFESAGPGQFSGLLKFEESDGVSEPALVVGSVDLSSFSFDAKMLLPTCAAPFCPIGGFDGLTYKIAALGLCLKVQLFEGGVLEADLSDPTCSNAVFTSSGVFSVFDSFDAARNIALFRSESSSHYEGFFYFESSTEVTGGSSPEATILSLDDGAKLFESRVMIASCP